MKKILMLIIMIFLISGCNIKPNMYSKDMQYMDTFINIKLYSNDEKLVNKAFKYIDNLYSDYDKLSDRYTSYEDLVNVNYINKAPINVDIKIDKRLYDVLEYGASYNSKTNYLFNIALGNPIDVWSKYRNGEKTGIPTIDELKNSGSTDLSALMFKDNCTIMKTKDISIDLGAIAKGYTTELVGKYLESIGLDKYLITAGTSSVKAGTHYNNDKYKIGLINPNEPDNIYKVINVENKTITTSGSYERYYDYNGVRYAHIIDPTTLFPTNYVLSVTVITDDASLGDILSTTLFLMPINDGLEFIKSFDGVDAIWYGSDGNIVTSEGMSAYE